MLTPPVSSSSRTSASLSTATTNSKRRRANFTAPSLSSSSSASSSSLSSRVSSAVVAGSHLLQMPRSILEVCIGSFFETNEVFQMKCVCRQLHDLRFHLYGSFMVPGAKKDNIPAVVNTYVIHSLDLTLDMSLPSNLTTLGMTPPFKCIKHYSKIFSQALPVFPLSALWELTVFSPPDVQPGFELSCIRVLNINYFHLDAHREAHNFFVGCSSVTALCIDQIVFPWNYKRQSYLAMFKRLTRLSFNSGPCPFDDVMTDLLSTPLPPLTVLNIPYCKVLISWVCSLSSLKALHVACCIDDVSAVGLSSSSELSQLSSSSLPSRRLGPFSNIFFESAALPPLNVLTIGHFGSLGTFDVYSDKWLVAPRCTTLTALNIREYNCEQSLPCDLSNYTNLTSLSFNFAFSAFGVTRKAQSIELRKFLSTAPPSLRKLEIGSWLGASLSSLPLSLLTELSVIWWSDEDCEPTEGFERDYPNVASASFAYFPLKTLFQFTNVLTHLRLSDTTNFNDEFVRMLPIRVPGLRSLEIIQDRPNCSPKETDIVGPYRLPIQHPTLTTLCFKEQWKPVKRQEATLIFMQRTISGRSYLVKYPDNPFYVVTDSRIPESSRWPLSVYAAAKTSTGPLLWTRFIIDNNYLRIET